MLRVEKSINELVEVMTRGFHLLRQNSIDEELFDLITGVELLKKWVLIIFHPASSIISLYTHYIITAGW